ncbi:MAG: pyruvate kinase [Rhodospirillales bacterium]
MLKEILCTLGPASMDERMIARLEALGISLFRINLSHTPLDKVEEVVRNVQSWTSVPLSLDTEGAQVRTGTLAKPFELKENEVVYAQREPILGDAACFNFYPYDIIDALNAGDLISIDFNSVLVQVVDKSDDRVKMRVLNGGLVGSNKAVTVERSIELPPLTDKDRGAVEIGMEMGVRHYALSFANYGKDVEFLRGMVGKESTIISKIECRNGIRNLEQIAQLSDAILIDRGDLSREIPIEYVPYYQKKIIKTVHDVGRKVYVATNLLESMVTMPVPTRAEVNDIYNTFLDGADGVVLAAETAIGKYPVACANMVAKMIDAFNVHNEDDTSEFRMEPLSLLIEPHGGRLVRNEAVSDDLADLAKLRRLHISREDIMDCEQIALGTYSPLDGFMDQSTLSSVLAENRLSDGTTWTMPILLQSASDEVRKMSKGERIVLEDDDGRTIALLDISEIYDLDPMAVAEQWFGTTSTDHPGVAKFLAAGTCCLAGKVTLVERPPSLYRHFELTPAQSRAIFTHKGWSRVVGFHTRNPCHRIHEFLQLSALQKAAADGIYISPVIGPKKPGDILPAPMMKTYQVLLDQGIYPPRRVVLGSFATFSRYCGPREAVFTALCRKNMGCSHFIIGRDHTGVGNFYSPDANRRMFEELPDLGIQPVFFDAVGYDPELGTYVEGGNSNHLSPISGTVARETLKRGERLPDWFMRDIVQDMILEEINADRPVFFE